LPVPDRSDAHPVGDRVLVLESLCCDFLLT
jgi:hypothetical protein